MSDIFVSYDSADKERVRALVQLLEAQGWTVWWDRKIPPGTTFAAVIEEAITAAKCVVVVWTASSVGSEWVRLEAAEGKRRGIFVPVLFDEVNIPFEFRGIYGAGLVGYPATSHDTGSITTQTQARLGERSSMTVYLPSAPESLRVTLVLLVRSPAIPCGSRCAEQIPL